MSSLTLHPLDVVLVTRPFLPCLLQPGLWRPVSALCTISLLLLYCCNVSHNSCMLWLMSPAGREPSAKVNGVLQALGTGSSLQWTPSEYLWSEHVWRLVCMGSIITIDRYRQNNGGGVGMWRQGSHSGQLLIDSFIHILNNTSYFIVSKILMLILYLENNSSPLFHFRNH